LVAAVFLAFAGLFSVFSASLKTNFIQERAAVSAGSPLVQTAQGANIDISMTAKSGNAAFSSLNSISDLDGTNSPSIFYPEGMIKDQGLLPVSK